MGYIEERLTNEGFDPVSVYKYILNARHLAGKHCYTDLNNNPLQDLYTIEFKILAEMAREFHPELVGIKNKNVVERKGMLRMLFSREEFKDEIVIKTIDRFKKEDKYVNDPEKGDRRIDIFNEWRSGKTYKEIMAKYDLSLYRVRKEIDDMICRYQQIWRFDF